MGLFGDSKKKDPKAMVREWSSKIRKEGYSLDRQIRGIEREEAKVKKSLKEAAKKGEKEACRVLATEIVRAQKAIKRIHITKANLKSVDYQMQNQLATVRVAGALEKSSQVMQSMQQLIKVPEIQATMRELSKEMMKAGIMEEMMEDTMEMMDDGGEDLEEEAQEEVDKVLWEITQGELGKAPAAVSDSLPVREPEGATAAVSDDEEVEDMQARLEALRS